MTGCPELLVLEGRPWIGEIRTHVAACGSCRLVMELIDERSQAAVSRDRRTECAHFEALIAVRVSGGLRGAGEALLDIHLAECDDCRALAETIAPADVVADHTTLPAIDPAAYTLGPEVARGGMGRIVAARDLRIGRPVAVKELLAKTTALTARFEREARVTARLQHPGIVPIYEIGRWASGTPFYAMRMVEGRTLRSSLATLTTLEARLALLPSVIAAADAVAFAHSQQVIHRDLTPSNIMVGDYGETVVIDWGLAKDLARDDDEVEAGPYRADPTIPSDLTAAGAVIGTAAYMPPEQARGERVDARADVYALGAILYHLLAGHAPFRGTNDEVIRLVKSEAPPPLPPTTPRDLASIAAKATARDARARYANAGELVEELRRFQTGRIVEAHEYSRRERIRRWVRRHRASVLASVAALVALTIAGVVGFVGVVGERNRAESEARAADDARQRTRHENALLMTEQGRQELLAGNPTRATAWLNEAYKAGDTSPELRFLLGSAMRQVESVERTADCGTEIESLELSTDQTKLLAACAYSVSISELVGGKVLMTTRLRNNGATISRDGTRIAARRYDHVIVLDASTGAQLANYKAHDAFIRTMAFTPDGRTLVTTGDDGKAKIWDVATGTLRHVLDAQSGKMNVVRGQITHDGATLVTATVDGRVIAWDIASGARKRVVTAPGRTAFANGFVSPDGNRVVACGIDGTVRVYELATAALLASFVAHPEAAMECSWDPTGKRILSTGLHDGTAKLWDVAKQALLVTFPHGGLMMQARVSPDGQRVVTSGGIGGFKLWHVPTGSLLGSLDDPFANGKLLLFSDDGRRVITAREPYEIVITKDLGAGPEPRRLPAHSSVIGVSPKATQLAVKDASEDVRLVDATTLVPVAHEPLRAPIAWSEDQTRFAAIAPSGEAVVLDATTGKVIAKLAVVSWSKISRLELDRHGRRLLSAGDAPLLWDVDAQRKLLDFPGRSGAGSLSLSGKLVLAWTDPTRVEIWDVERATVKTTLVMASQIEEAVFFDAREKRIVIAEQNSDIGRGALPIFRRLSIYDVASGERVFTTPGRIFPIMDFSAQRVVSAGLNAKLEIRSAHDGTLLSGFTAGTSSIFMLGTVESSGQLAIVNDFSSVAVRSATDGRMLATLQPKLVGLTFTQDNVNYGTDDFALSLDGKTVVLQGESPIVWRLPSEQRTPEEVDRIVSARIRWRIVDGRLVPVEGTLRGRVMRDGKPVSGARVAMQAPVWSNTTTGSDGRFEFPDLRVGTYFLIAMASDKTAKGIHSVAIVPEGVSRDFDLDEVATISGETVDEAGKPIAGVHVRADIDDDGGLVGISDNAGRFTIRALAARTYKLGVLRVVDGKPTGHTHVGEPVAVEVTSKSATVTGVRIVVRDAP